MTATPRTDTAWKRHLIDPTTEDADPWLLASELERKLAAMTTERDKNRQLYETERKDHLFMRKTLDRVVAERDALKAKLP